MDSTNEGDKSIAVPPPENQIPAVKYMWSTVAELPDLALANPIQLTVGIAHSYSQSINSDYKRELDSAKKYLRRKLMTDLYGFLYGDLAALSSIFYQLPLTSVTYKVFDKLQEIRRKVMLFPEHGQANDNIGFAEQAIVRTADGLECTCVIYCEKQGVHPQRIARHVECSPCQLIFEDEASQPFVKQRTRLYELFTFNQFNIPIYQEIV